MRTALQFACQHPRVQPIPALPRAQPPQPARTTTCHAVLRPRTAQLLSDGTASGYLVPSVSPAAQGTPESLPKQREQAAGPEPTGDTAKAVFDELTNDHHRRGASDTASPCLQTALADMQRADSWVAVQHVLARFSHMPSDTPQSPAADKAIPQQGVYNTAEESAHAPPLVLLEQAVVRIAVLEQHNMAPDMPLRFVPGLHALAKCVNRWIQDQSSVHSSNSGHDHPHIQPTDLQFTEQPSANTGRQPAHILPSNVLQLCAQATEQPSANTGLKMAQVPPSSALQLCARGDVGPAVRVVQAMAALGKLFVCRRYIKRVLSLSCDGRLTQLPPQYYTPLLTACAKVGYPLTHMQTQAAAAALGAQMPALGAGPAAAALTALLRYAERDPALASTLLHGGTTATVAPSSSTNAATPVSSQGPAPVAGPPQPMAEQVAATAAAAASGVPHTQGLAGLVCDYIQQSEYEGLSVRQLADLLAGLHKHGVQLPCGWVDAALGCVLCVGNGGDGERAGAYGATGPQQHAAADSSRCASLQPATQAQLPAAATSPASAPVSTSIPPSHSPAHTDQIRTQHGPTEPWPDISPPSHPPKYALCLLRALATLAYKPPHILIQALLEQVKAGMPPPVSTPDPVLAAVQPTVMDISAPTSVPMDVAYEGSEGALGIIQSTTGIDSRALEARAHEGARIVSEQGLNAAHSVLGTEQGDTAHKHSGAQQDTTLLEPGTILAVHEGTSILGAQQVTTLLEPSEAVAACQALVALRVRPGVDWCSRCLACVIASPLGASSGSACRLMALLPQLLPTYPNIQRRWVASQLVSLETLTSGVAGYLSTATSPELTDFITGCAELRYHPGEQFLHWHASRCQALRKVFPQDKLVQVLGAYSSLGFQPPFVLAGAMEKAVTSLLTHQSMQKQRAARAVELARVADDKARSTERQRRRRAAQRQRRAAAAQGAS